MHYLIFALLILLSPVESTAQNKYKTKSFAPSYRTFGKGAPILIINGGPGMNSNGFAEIAQKIADLGYQTIIFDQRGTGKSALKQIDSNTITMDLMVEDMENLRRKLKIDKWTVMGHSFGGLLACAYYAKYPNHVQKLVFSSSGGVNLKFRNYVGERIQNNLTTTERDSFNLYANKMSQGDTTRATMQKRANFLANAYVYNKKFSSIIAGRLMEVNFAINRLVFQDLTKINFDYTHKFQDKEIPVLVLQGKNDIITVETAEEIKNSFGKSRIVLFDNCAHYGWLDAPEQYFEALKTFLKE